MKVEIDVPKTLEAIERKIAEIDSLMTSSYIKQVPLSRRRWLKFALKIRNLEKKSKRNPNWLIKRNVKRALKYRFEYENACSYVSNILKEGALGEVLDRLIDLSDNIKKTSREFPNQPIILDEDDLRHIFLDISQESVDTYVNDREKDMQEKRKSMMRKYNHRGMK